MSLYPLTANVSKTAFSSLAFSQYYCKSRNERRWDSACARRHIKPLNAHQQAVWPAGLCSPRRPGIPSAGLSPSGLRVPSNLRCIRSCALLPPPSPCPWGARVPPAALSVTLSCFPSRRLPAAGSFCQGFASALWLYWVSFRVTKCLCLWCMSCCRPVGPPRKEPDLVASEPLRWSPGRGAVPASPRSLGGTGLLFSSGSSVFSVSRNVWRAPESW